MCDIGIDVKVADDRGNTALWIALRSRQEAVAKKLVTKAVVMCVLVVRGCWWHVGWFDQGTCSVLIYVGYVYIHIHVHVCVGFVFTYVCGMFTYVWGIYIYVCVYTYVCIHMCGVCTHVCDMYTCVCVCVWGM